jgi:DNA-binding GntR family transcriptional regulator
MSTIAHWKDEIHAESITNQVYALLKRQIANGQLKPGERIMEKDIAHQLGISRTPVREALLKLEANGIVVFNNRRSYNVRRLTLEDVAEIYQVCGLLESAVAYDVAHTLTESDIGTLEGYNEQLKIAADREDRQGFAHYNHKFHEFFLERHPNRTLRETCNTLRQLLYAFPSADGTILHESHRKSFLEHQEIIRLAAARQARQLADYFRNVHWNFENNLSHLTALYHAASQSECD